MALNAARTRAPQPAPEPEPADEDTGGMSKTQLKAAKRAAKKAAKQKKKGGGAAEPEPVQEEEVGADGLLIGGPAAGGGAAATAKDSGVDADGYRDMTVTGVLASDPNSSDVAFKSFSLVFQGKPLVRVRPSSPSAPRAATASHPQPLAPSPARLSGLG